MRLLFDQNLSRNLPERLSEIFPESAHVSRLGLSAATDIEVWSSAKANDYVIVSKDSDFNDILFLRGSRHTLCGFSVAIALPEISSLSSERNAWRLNGCRRAAMVF